MPRSTLLRSASFAALSLVAACSRRASTTSATSSAIVSTAVAPSADDDELAACEARVAELDAAEALPGDPALDVNRIAILGRARGEPMVMTRAPREATDETISEAARAARVAFARGVPGARVATAASRYKHAPEILRALFLREGYAYTTEPHDAFELVRSVHLADLFDDASIVLQRGGDTRTLERSAGRFETVYRYVDGPLRGRAADLLFGDRVAVDGSHLDAPLHRDLASVADREGFDRVRLERVTERGILASVRFGATRARAVLASDGAALSLTCLAEPRAVRDAVQLERDHDRARRRAMLALHDVVTEELHESFRFDRPDGVTGPDRDGELRPLWATAYLQGRTSFEDDGTRYDVFDAEGNAWPPEVCVDFVLDSFERTAGSWFKPRKDGLGRVKGRLSFDDEGIANRRGVIAFGDFAASRDDLFDFVRLKASARVPFRDRDAFFAWFGAHEDEVRAGDVVAIQGVKADGRIHQHAILVERTDPITGFPYGLADQMKRPRRRTWEGIMAEAPARSLYYRARLRDVLFEKMDPGAP